MRMVMCDKHTLCGVVLLVAALAFPATALPPDPNNAALLYYQAFLACPEAKDPIGDMVAKAAGGEAAPNEQVVKYLESCRGAIDLAIAAAQLDRCDWGLMYSKGFSMQMSYLAQVRRLSRVLLARGSVLASKGDYRKAFEHCLTAQKLARHVGDSTVISYLVYVAVDSMAIKWTTNVLGQMPQDPQLLLRVKEQLAALYAAAPSIERPMQLEREVAVRTMRVGNEQELAQVLSDSTGKRPEGVPPVMDEAFFSRARQHYSEFMDSAIAALRGDLPYEKTCKELERLATKLEQDGQRDPAAGLVAKALVPAVARICTLHVRHAAQVNSLRAALEIYLANARVGKLPDVLPHGVPEDPYSGEDFEYRRSADGFTLRCRVADVDKKAVQEYTFKTPK